MPRVSMHKPSRNRFDCALSPRVLRLKKRLYESRPGWTNGTERFASLIRDRLRPGMTVLDLGAGEGGPGSLRFRDPALRIVGLDVERYIANNSNVDHTIVASAFSLPFAPQTFDVVFSDWVVEHFEKPEIATAEIRRVLKPGGHFLFRTGNLLHYSYAIAAATPHWFHRLVANPVRGLPRDAGDPHPTYYRMNTAARARELMRSANLAEVQLLQVETEPSYLQFSAPSFLAGVAYERLVNGWPALAGWRACLFGCFQKPERYSGDAPISA